MFIGSLISWLFFQYGSQHSFCFPWSWCYDGPFRGFRLFFIEKVSSWKELLICELWLESFWSNRNYSSFYIFLSKKEMDDLQSIHERWAPHRASLRASKTKGKWSQRYFLEKHHHFMFNKNFKWDFRTFLEEARMDDIQCWKRTFLTINSNEELRVLTWYIQRNDSQRV